MSTIEVQRGFPDHLRPQAAAIYDAAFGEKLRLAIPSKKARLQILATGFHPDFSLAATHAGHLVGLAGFRTEKDSLTGGITGRVLVERRGVVLGTWAALSLAAFDRPLTPGQLLLDGIAVAPQMRGRGIGGALLSSLRELAGELGFDEIRLDVIDTNPRARRLYERTGFVKTATERFGYLRWLLGFGAVDRMICAVA